MKCAIGIELETDTPEELLEELAQALKFSAKLLALRLTVDGDPE